mgnify:CR=1 FL=1
MRSVFVFSSVGVERVAEYLDATVHDNGGSTDHEWVQDRLFWIRVQSPPTWWDGFAELRAALSKRSART